MNDEVERTIDDWVKPEIMWTADEDITHERKAQLCRRAIKENIVVFQSGSLQVLAQPLIFTVCFLAWYIGEREAQRLDPYTSWDDASSYLKELYKDDFKRKKIPESSLKGFCAEFSLGYTRAHYLKLDLAVRRRYEGLQTIEYDDD